MAQAPPQGAVVRRRRNGGSSRQTGGVAGALLQPKIANGEQGGLARPIVTGVLWSVVWEFPKDAHRIRLKRAQLPVILRERGTADEVYRYDPL
ncbi:hypothetical protein TRAPUB_13912 [Trametes pubescens]|uniref:Uncharacterized protein n=1 Tax=Trametes pubescens TaxID=154538 RepID=A0A1M2VPT7_TRAPU|nr:hypothetical protein TRAPUB_13912 [Trametes pubescens]